MRIITPLFLLFVLLVSCGPPQPQPITNAEYRAMQNPPAGLLAKIDQVLPAITAELRESEAIALKNGRPLTAQEMADARAVGVKHPEKIRIYATNDFPEEDERARKKGVLVAFTAIYGIYIHPDYIIDASMEREVLTHEFVHVWQFETYGVEHMARRFLIEWVTLGDKLIPIEREAIERGNAVYDDPRIAYGV